MAVYGGDLAQLDTLSRQFLTEIDAVDGLQTRILGRPRDHRLVRPGRGTIPDPMGSRLRTGAAAPQGSTLGELFRGQGPPQRDRDGDELAGVGPSGFPRPVGRSVAD